MASEATTSETDVEIGNSEVLPSVTDISKDNFLWFDSENNDSDSDSENSLSETNNNKFQNLSDELRHWSVKHQITQLAMTALLCVLRKHPCFDELLSTEKTLLDTPSTLSIHNVQPGQIVT
jgi:hypothetical protein